MSTPKKTPIKQQLSYCKDKQSDSYPEYHVHWIVVLSRALSTVFTFKWTRSLDCDNEPIDINNRGLVITSQLKTDQNTRPG